MRRNAAGQTIQAMMRMASPMIGVIVPMSNSTVNTASAATPCLVTCTAAHGLVPGNIVVISGVTGNANANGTFRVGASGITTTAFSIYNPDTGAAIVGSGAGTGGTVVCQSVAVTVTKDGGTPTLGTGTLTHIGREFLGAAYTATKVQVVSSAATFTATAAFVGNTNQPTTGASVSSTTLGLWSYTPTAGETNAASVAFTFTSPATVGGTTPTAGAVSVTQSFEPTAGPILYQASLSATGGAVTNQTTIVLPSATPIPPADNDAFSNCTIVFYDATNDGQMSVGVISAYVGSTRTITLREAPTFTVTSSDYITIIADTSIRSAIKNRNLVVDAAGLADANTVKIGPTGTGMAQTALDLGGIIADSVPADGTRPTLQQAAYMLTQFMLERAVSGTTVTVKKVDGSTSLFTLTLSDATSPVSITRAT